MRIFLSYARTNECVAAEVALALRAEGHEVFFDRASLLAGNEFHRLIREEINSADALVFLVSPSSICRGSYALTELKFAQERWPNPARRVLPTLVEPISIDDLPPYLRAVTVLDPAGNVAAEVAAAICRFDMGDTTQARSKVRVLVHAACFAQKPEHPALFVNVTNLSAEREAEVTHVWVETSPTTHVMTDARRLPTRLRPFESWETWVYIDQLPSIPDDNIYELARVRLSTGEVFSSSRNVDVPERGFVAGARQK